MVAAVVLAAGAASRFGRPKQELLLPYVVRRVRAATEIQDVVVVLGAHRFPVAGARTVVCEDWDRGPGASLLAGLAALTDDTEAAIVCLADGPLLAPAAVDRVVRAWRGKVGTVVAASYGGVRGHPVCLDRSVWGEITEDGGRSLEPALVPCDDLGDPGDVDTADDLLRLKGQLGDD